MAGKRQALIDKRKELGYSQTDMAKFLGVSQSTYFFIENGAHNPSIEICIKIGHILCTDGIAIMNSIDEDINIYNKDEMLRVIWIFIRNHNTIDMIRVKNSNGDIRDLSLDEFSNILYYRSPVYNVVYEDNGYKNIRIDYLKDKSKSLLTWCNNCNNEKYVEYIKDHTQLPRGITLDDFSTGSVKVLKFKCDKGHEYEKTIYEITNRMCGCPECSKYNGTSYAEQFIYLALNSIYKCNNRYKIGGLEVDIYIPEKKLCIEFNGEYWHYGKEEYDERKRDSIVNLGYNFVTVNEHRGNGCNKFNGNSIEFYYTDKNRNYRLKELVEYIVNELLQSDSSSIDFKEVEKNAWEYSKGKIPFEKSVAYQFPELLCELDDSNDVKLEDITPGGRHYITWRCKNCNFRWNTSIYKRTSRKSGCPSCGYNTFVNRVDNNITNKKYARDSAKNVVKVYPELEKEFISELNDGKALSDYTVGSNIMIKWKCTRCKNTFNTVIYQRTHYKTGCIHCGYNIFTGEINKNSIGKSANIDKPTQQISDTMTLQHSKSGLTVLINE